MVKHLKKLLVIILLILLLGNFVIVTKSNATTPEFDDNVTQEEIDAKNEALQEKDQSFLDSFVGLVTYIPRIIAIGIGYGINALTAGIAYIEGVTDASVDTTFITPFEIFFNKVKILDINFFEIGDKVTIVNTIRTGVAAWYYVLRLIAISILLVVLVYVGIRMAISTVATDKAMYKKMLADWAVSLVLIFLVNYIIIFVISLNNTAVEAISKNVKSQEIQNTYSTIKVLATDLWDIDSIPATIIFCMLVWQTLGLIINYFNRMLKVAFLIIISPLITLTYSIDKMGDGKAQALGNWIREFVFTVIIQIFHCIIYMCFINVAFELLIEDSTGALATSIMAILCVNFVKEAENLVRKILMHNHQDNTTSLAAGTAMTVAAISKSKSLGTAAIKSANATRQGLRVAGNAFKSAGKTAGRIATLPVGAVRGIQNKVEWGKVKKSDEYKEGRENLKKRVEANGGKFGKKHEWKYKRDKKAEIKAKRESTRKEKWKKSRAGQAYNTVIGGARGTAKSVNTFRAKMKEVRANSDVYQTVSSIAKAYTRSWSWTYNRFIYVWSNRESWSIIWYGNCRCTDGSWI